MTALAHNLRLDAAAPQLKAPGDAPRGWKWIDVAEAARRLQVTKRSVVRKAANDWQPRGLAKKVNHQGNQVWLIYEAADPQLCPIPQADKFDAKQLTVKQQRMLYERKQVVMQWRAYCRRAEKSLGSRFNKSDATQSFLATLQVHDITVPARATLYQWSEDYASKGLQGLVDGRWKPRQDKRNDDPFYQVLKKLWLHPHRFSMRLAYRMAIAECAQKGITQTPTYRSAARFLKDIPEDEKDYYRGGKKEFNDKALPYAEGDYSDLAVHEAWNSDHHQLDLFVTDGKGCKPFRPWLTAIQDLRTRVIVGWVLSKKDPNSDQILQAVYQSVTDHGLPELMIVDNGKDYQSHAVTGNMKRKRRKAESIADISPSRLSGCFNILDVEVSYCWPYHGQSKPIERWFRTLEEQFCILHNGYCGSSPQKQPSSFKKEMSKPEELLTLDELEALLGNYIEKTYHQSKSEAIGLEGMSPAAIYAKYCGAQRIVDPCELSIACLKATRDLSISRNGLTWKKARYDDPMLRPYRGKGKCVRLRYDPNNMESVMVFDLQDRLICEAKRVQRQRRVKTTEEDWKRSEKRRSEVRKAAQVLRENGLQLVMSPSQLAEQEAVIRMASEAPPAPKDHKPDKKVHVVTRLAQASDMKKRLDAIDSDKPLRKLSLNHFNNLDSGLLDPANWPQDEEEGEEASTLRQAPDYADIADDEEEDSFLDELYEAAKAREQSA